MPLQGANDRFNIPGGPGAPLFPFSPFKSTELCRLQQSPFSLAPAIKASQRSKINENLQAAEASDNQPIWSKSRFSCRVCHSWSLYACLTLLMNAERHLVVLPCLPTPKCAKWSSSYKSISWSSWSPSYDPLNKRVLTAFVNLKLRFHIW